MATLTGQTIAATYDALLKVTDNGPITSSLKLITDGLGNNTALSLSSVSASITGTLSVTSTIGASNLSGTNTGDETNATIKTKLGAASASEDGYLTSTDWSTFNNKQSALGYTPVPNTRTLTINGTSYDLSADRSWTIVAGVSSFNTRTGAITLTSLDVTNSLGFTPVTNARTLTINGTTYDLSANRSWTISAGISGSGTAGRVSRFLTSTSITDAPIYIAADETIGEMIGIGDSPNSAPTPRKLYVSGSSYFNGSITSPSNVRALRFHGGPSEFTNHSTLLHIITNTLVYDPIARFSNTENTDSNSKTSVWLEAAGGWRGEFAYTTNLNGSNIYINNTYSSGNILFNIAGSEKLRIASSGNVGIGTSSPAAKLSVNKAFQSDTITIANSSAFIYGADVGLAIGQQAGAPFGTWIQSIRTDNVVFPLLINTSGGNVGIGTSSPSQRLQVGNGSGTGGQYARFYHSATDIYIGQSGGTIFGIGSGAGSFILSDNASYPFGVGTTNSQPLILGTTNNEHMRITSGGNVLIGTTSTASVYKFVVKQGTDRNLAIGAQDSELSIEAFNDAITAGVPLRIYSSKTQILGGNVGIGTTSPSYQLQLSTDSAAKPTSALWTIASDLRIKENITPYAKGLKELMLINPINYDYNGLGGFKKGKGGVGIIAQEILNILPDSVSSVKGKLNEGDKEEIDILNFNGHELTYILINAIKEQQAQIEELKLLIKK